MQGPPNTSWYFIIRGLVSETSYNTFVPVTIGGIPLPPT
jgi:hypothetical protein